MEILGGVAELSKLSGPAHVCLGMFDGVHLGHQTLLNRAIAQREKGGGSAVALTFNPHPSEVLRPGSCPPLLTCSVHRTEILSRIGLDAVVIHPFTPEFSRISPLEFLELLQASCRPLGSLVSGERFRFGHKGAGTVDDIRAFAAREGISACAMPPLLHGGEVVSSTRIRRALRAGNLVLAAELLGRPCSVWGQVKPGRQTGRTLGFPTANYHLSNEALPSYGVYAVRAEGLRGVANLGVRPTIGDLTSPVLEAHWFDFDGDLYGRSMEVQLEKWLRPERKFSGLEELRVRIQADAAAAREFFS